MMGAMAGGHAVPAAVMMGSGVVTRALNAASEWLRSGCCGIR